MTVSRKARALDASALHSHAERSEAVLQSLVGWQVTATKESQRVTSAIILERRRLLLVVTVNEDTIHLPAGSEVGEWQNKIKL